MTARSSGFTLIELLVVVAILGIIATLGINAYSGYVAGTKKQSAKNVMQQISLGQSEYVSQNGEYYYTHANIYIIIFSNCGRDGQIISMDFSRTCCS